MQLQDGFGGDAQSALVAHEQMLELVPAGTLADLASAAVADTDYASGRSDHLETEHQVARVSVATADQRPAARADPAADQGAGIRGGVVRIDKPIHVERLVQLEHVDA